MNELCFMVDGVELAVIQVLSPSADFINFRPPQSKKRDSLYFFPKDA